MSPPSRVRGSGGGGSVPPEGGTGEVSPSTPPAESSPLPESADTYSFPPTSRYFRNLTGETFLLILNPAAQDRRIGKELQYFIRTFNRTGARVIPVETHPDESIRQQRIFDQTQSALLMLSQERPEVALASLLSSPAEAARVDLKPSQRLTVTSYAGDTTFGEVVEGSLAAAGFRLDPNSPHVPAETSQRIRDLMVYFVPNKGTAADLAVQMGAPKDISDMPKFLRTSVELPFWFPTVELTEKPGVHRAAVHNFGMGESGYIFHRRQQNVKDGPHWYNLWGRLNKGLISYLRLLLPAMANRYGILGFDVELKRFNAQGKLTQETTLRGSEVITTPNQIMAGVAGIPGKWGETRVVVLPALLPSKGLALPALLEFIWRGIATKVLRLNLVGPRNRPLFLSRDRQWIVGEGERVEVKVRVPNTFSWDFIRFMRDRRARLGLGEPGPEIPAAGEPLKIPAQLNGDPYGETSGFTVRSPRISIPIEAHPNKLGVRLARASTLINGEPPLISDQEVASFIEGHEPSVLMDDPDKLRVRTPFFSQPRLRRILSQRGLGLDQKAELQLATQGVKDSEGLHQLGHRDLTVERMEEFLSSETGREWTAPRRRIFSPLGQRLVQGGVPLATGIGSLFVGEHIADALGLDPVLDRAARFGLVIYFSHGVSANTAPLWEVISNRMLGRSYDFVRPRMMRAAGETFVQMTYESNASLPRALWSSWKSGAMGLQIGIQESLAMRTLRLGGIPFLAGWNMGEGLIFSRVAEHLVSGLPENSAIRRWAPTAAFFIPDVHRMISPRSSFAVMNRRPTRFAARAVAVGFMADMAYTGIHRLYFGQRAGYDLIANHRAADLRSRGNGFSRALWAIPRFLAPSLVDHMASHDYFFGGANEYKRRVIAEDRELSFQLQGAIRHDLSWMPPMWNRSPQEILGSEVALNEDEQLMLEQLEHCRGGRLLRADAGFEETLSYLQDQFSGMISSRGQAREHLLRIHAHQLQRQIAFLHQLEIPENNEIRHLFDSRGRLVAQNQMLLTWLNPTSSFYG